MFATVSRGRGARRQTQEVIEVPPGVDSCFGVRSLNGSVEWEVGAPRTPHDLAPEEGDARDTADGDRVEDDEGEGGEEDETRGQSAQGAEGVREGGGELGLRIEGEAESRSESQLSEDTPVAPPWCQLPLSPTTTLADPTSSASPATVTPPTPGYDRQHAYHGYHGEHADHGDHGDNLSEPSSPASFTSMPTVSSMSRTSSPIGDIDYRSPSSAAGPEGLVLPTLSLPSTSLHMSLRRWDGDARGIKVALLGSVGAIRRAVRELGERVELVELRAKGQVGVLRDGQVDVVLITGLGETRIDSKISDAYAALHALLHPSPPRGTSDKVKAMIQSWARREDWIHLVYAVESETSLVKSLAPIVPVLFPCSADMGADVPLFTLPSHAEPVSPAGRADPTPMPRQSQNGSATEYFSIRGDTETSLHVETLLQVIEDSNAPSIESASISRFLSWRPPSLDSSISTSTASSAYEPPLMPTVARAQGGGEWEATLSRRIAKRREVVERPSRGKPRRRRTSQSQERAPFPLFPRRSASLAAGKGGTQGVGLGVVRLVGSALEKARGVMRGKWRWVGVAAVAVALGWGLWAAKAKF